MKEKIIEKFDEKKFKWYDAYNNDFICINDHPLSDEIKDFISQALDEYGAEKYEKGYLDGKNNQPRGLNK